MRVLLGRNWRYDYRHLTRIGDGALSRGATATESEFRAIAESWDVNANSAWTCQFYLAAKMILAATLQLNAANYAAGRNLRVVLPYLRYYAALSLCRCVYYTLPSTKWRNGDAIRVSHSVAIGATTGHITRFDRPLALEFESWIRRLKGERELISYRAPSSGDDQVRATSSNLEMCSFLAEIAQFNSELLEGVLETQRDHSCRELRDADLSLLAGAELEKSYFGDREDALRLSRLARKQPFPVSLVEMMTDGHVEEFFGAWTEAEPHEGHFDPDSYWAMIFDIP